MGRIVVTRLLQLVPRVLSIFVVSLEKMRQVDEFQAVQIQVGFIAHARNIPVALDVKIVVHA